MADGTKPPEPCADEGDQDVCADEVRLLEAQKAAFRQAVHGDPLEAALESLIQIAVDGTHGELRCGIYRVDSTGTLLRHLAGMPDTYADAVDGFRVAGDSLSCGLAVYNGKPVITPDVRLEPLWKPWLWLAEAHKFRACWSFPIETDGGDVVGTLAFYYKNPRVPSANDLEMATVLNQAAAVLISRQQFAEERAQLVERLVTSIEDERASLSRELHDNLSQVMVAMKLDLHPLKQFFERHEDPDAIPAREGLQRLTEGITRLISSAHQQAWELRPPELDELGLASSLENYLLVWAERTGVSFEWEESGKGGDGLPATAQIALYRIFQEALGNVFLHAKATHLIASLSVDGECVRLSVKDDGDGFDQKRSTSRLGIVGMRERMRLIGGDLEVAGEMGQGTKVTASVPLPDLTSCP